VLARLRLAIRRRIAVKLALTLVGFVAVILLVAALYLARSLDALAEDAAEMRLLTAGRLLHDEARELLARGADAGALTAFVGRAARADELRVTLIAVDGRVLADSEVPPAALAGVESHAGRPEVVAALAAGRGRDLRLSATVKAPLLYVALPVLDEGRPLGVLRLALPVATVTASHEEIRRVLLAGGILALAVALGIALFVARRIARPAVVMQEVARAMADGNFRVRAPVRSPDEIGALGRSLNALAERLRTRLEDLQHEQAKGAALLDGMVEGVIAVDGHDHVVLMNERARAMFDLGAAPGDREPILEVIRNADLHRVLRTSRAAGEGIVSRGELSLAGPVERVLQVNAVPLRLGPDEVGVVMVVHDVTELRRLERVRTEFVANVSHELRTPLTAVHGYLETLLGGALEEPEHARRFLEIVFRHTERLGRLLSDLTDLSNIELGKVTLRPAPVRLGEIVDSVFAINRPRADAGSVALSADIAPGAAVVHADLDRLVQILINLVDNAIKYTAPGGQVAVTARRDEDRVEIAVRDTGVGIPPADLPRITERFYRVDRARSRELGGTGLGLAIVKHLVIAHGGTLAIDSAPGQGTTVRFTLAAGDPGAVP
jgi:two-component system phosphate regulon sensor histidine kinase PhoR